MSLNTFGEGGSQMAFGQGYCQLEIYETLKPFINSIINFSMVLRHPL